MSTSTFRGCTPLVLLMLAFALPGTAPGQDPKKVDPKSESAYQVSVEFSFGGSELAQETFAVPDGKRLVIEHVSGVVHVDATMGDALSDAFLLVLPVDGAPIAHKLVFDKEREYGGNRIYSVDKSVRLYCDSGPGSVITSGRAIQLVNLASSPVEVAFSGPGFASFSIAGYLVDLP